MRKNFSWARFVAIGFLLVGSGSLAHAQGPAAGGVARPAAPPASGAATPRTSAGQVVVIDINEVFKNHTRHKAALEDIKKSAKEIEASAQEQQKHMNKLREKLGEYNAGTKPYKDTEEEMARMGSDLNLQMQLKRKEFVEREAKVYFNTYTEICDHVADFAERNGISLVLQFSKGDIDPLKPDTVAVGIRRPVVYHSNLDITSLIIERVNRGTPTANRDSRPAIPPRTQTR